MRLHLALAVLAVFATASFADEIRNGAAMRVKENSMWFEEAGQLARWQDRKKGDQAAFAAYQDNILRHREAWQFIYAQDVKILRYEPAKNRVHVLMTGEGRMRDTRWFVEPDAIVK